MITIDEVIQKAKLVGVDVSNNRSSEVWAVDLLDFAKQFVINERELCAQVCDEYADKCVETENWEAEDASLHCAATIRARSQHE